MRSKAQAHNDQQRRYFTGRPLPRMDPVQRSATPYTRRHLEAALAALSLAPGARVLDVGCGPGKYTVGLAGAGLAVEGMDLTPGLLGLLNEVRPDIPTHLGDLCDPPAHLHGAFDAVTGFFVLHHVSDLDAALAGTRRLLRPGGRAAFLEPNPLFPGYYLQITFTPGMSWRGERGLFRMRPARLQAAAEAAGLGAFATSAFGAFPPFLANRPGGSRAERSLEAVPGWRHLRAFQLFTMRGN